MLLTLEVAWEPLLKPVSLRQAMADITAVDDRGQALTVEDPKAQSEALTHADATATEIALPLALPRGAKEIATLKGTLEATVPGKVETFRFPDPLGGKKNIEQRIAAATVTLEEARKNGDAVWEVRMRLRFDAAGDALASHRNWILSNEAYLTGPDGKPIPCDTSEMTMQSDRRDRHGLRLRLGASAQKADVRLQNARVDRHLAAGLRAARHQAAVEPWGS